MSRIMFDTNIFNLILDGKYDLGKLSDASYFVTHIQRDEIAATKCDRRREELEKIFKSMIRESIAAESRVLEAERLDESRPGGEYIPTESMILDYSNWDEAKFGEGCLFEQILNTLKKLNKRKRKVDSHIMDSLIAETAIMNELTLMTADKDLYLAVITFGGSVELVSDSSL